MRRKLRANVVTGWLPALAGGSHSSRPVPLKSTTLALGDKDRRWCPREDGGLKLVPSSCRHGGCAQPRGTRQSGWVLGRARAAPGWRGAFLAVLRLQVKFCTSGRPGPTGPAELTPRSPCVLQNVSDPRAPPREGVPPWPVEGALGTHSPGKMAFALGLDSEVPGRWVAQPGGECGPIHQKTPAAPRPVEPQPAAGPRVPKGPGWPLAGRRDPTPGPGARRRPRIARPAVCRSSPQLPCAPILTRHVLELPQSYKLG